MKKIIKKRWLVLGIFCIFFLLIFIFHNKFIGILIGMKSEQNIGEYILKNTPVGSSRDAVRTFIEKKGYKIRWDKDYPHTIRGITVPEQPPRVPPFSNPENKRGAKNIYVCIGGIYEIVYVMCAWVFDEDGNLLFIDVSKEWNMW